MTSSDRFVAVLADAAVPMCDDCIAAAAGYAQRQRANADGRALADAGAIHRAKGRCARCGRYKSVSWPLDGSPPVGGLALVPAPVPGPALGPLDRPWHWEGNVQAALATHLAANGYKLLQVVDTASKAAGVDIIAERGSETLWVTVKGYPVGTPRTNASMQSRHWFSHAMFDVVRYRTERPDIAIGVGLPDGFTSYLNLCPKVAWLKKTAPFRFLWVAEDGRVREE